MRPETSAVIVPGSSGGHPPGDPGPDAPPPAAEVVHRFLQGLRRRDLGALAALLSVGGQPDDPAARDGAQVVLRSMSGSGLIDTELHPSTDGSTVFVDFRRDHPDTEAFGGRLLRFTTSGGLITRIREYFDKEYLDTAFFSSAYGDPAPATRLPGPGAVPVSPAAGGIDWPSLNDDRAAARRVGER